MAKSNLTPDDEDERPDTFFDHISSLAFLVGFFWLAYIFVRWLAATVLGVAERIQQTAADPSVAIPIGFAVLISGALLWWLRERRRKIYAAIELGSAFGAAVEACFRYATNTSDPAFFFTLLGALYIAVRGFDNLAVARKEALKRKESNSPNEPSA